MTRFVSWMTLVKQTYNYILFMLCVIASCKPFVCRVLNVGLMFFVLFLANHGKNQVEEISTVVS